MGWPCIFGTAVHAIGTGIGACLAKFRGDNNLLSSALKRFSQETFIVSPAIHVSRIKKVDAQVQCMLDHGQAVLVSGCPIDA